MKYLLAIPLFLAWTPVFAATIDIGGIFNFLLVIIVVALIFWLIWWLVGYVGIPEPFNKVVRVILAVAAVFILIAILLSLIGGGPVLTIR